MHSSVLNPFTDIELYIISYQHINFEWLFHGIDSQLNYHIGCVQNLQQHPRCIILKFPYTHYGSLSPCSKLTHRLHYQGTTITTPNLQSHSMRREIAQLKLYELLC